MKTLVLDGDITLGTVERWLNAVDASQDTVLDWSGVKRLDSAAIALLLHWQRLCLAQRTTLRMSGMPNALTQLAALYGVQSLLPEVL
ncbi:STAS domain-containing protein [Chitinibacteraceae bacterium HSL-7]